MRITYIGHATLLIEIGGARILTDPNFDSALGKFLPRVTPPGIPIESLPGFDALLMTHAHADHLSLRSLELLPKSDVAVAPPAVATWLTRLGHATTGLAPDESITLGGGEVYVHAARATHVGARYGFDRWRGQANMYLIETDAESVLFTGDTALESPAEDLVRRVLWDRGRELDVALLPIGHAPRWKLRSFRRGHLTTSDALELFTRLRARHFMPFHWGTFRHVTAGAHDAIRRLRAELPNHRRAADVRIVEPGDSLVIDPAPRD